MTSLVAAVTPSPVPLPQLSCRAAKAAEALALAVSPPSPCRQVAAFATPPKRKRPAMIDIPKGPAPAPAVWEAEGDVVVEAEGEGYSVCCRKGGRRAQIEDRYDAAIVADGNSRMAFFGVFDGHGGTKVAEYLSRNMKKRLMDELAKVGGGRGEVEQAIKASYLSLDQEICSQGTTGGACSVTALLKNNQLFVANAGDCRAVVSMRGTAEAITSDHRPSRQDERDRIEHLGGFVMGCHGVLRVQGSLAVSRAFGDAHLKQWVVAEPETVVLNLGPDHEFLIMASDGLWEKVSDQEAVDIAQTTCANSSSPLLACRRLVELSVARGSADDTSVMVVQLSRFCRTDEF